MVWAKNGDIVKVHFTGKLADGSVFDSSHERDPLQITIGRNEMMPGIEEALLGMEPGQHKTATVPVEKAYGPHRDEMVEGVDRKQFPDYFQLEVGQWIQLERPDGEQLRVTVAEISDSIVVLDANHPLCGKNLTFDIELLEIV